MQIIGYRFRLQSVANFRAHVLSRTSISPNLGQQFRWIRGQWQRPFPSPRDRVAPPTATPHRRRKSLPGRLMRDVDDGLTSRHRAILLRSSKKLPATRPTGTAVRFDDVTKRSPPSTAHQLKGVSGPAYQQSFPAHQLSGAAHQEIGLARQPLGPTYEPPALAASIYGEQIEVPAYHSGVSAYQPPALSHQTPGAAHQRPVVACHPQQPHLGDIGRIAAVRGANIDERMHHIHTEQEETWSYGVEHGPAWSRTMAAPMSRGEATLSFTHKPQTHGLSPQGSQSQLPSPHSPIDRSVVGTTSVSSNRPSSLQLAPQPVEPMRTGPMGGASSVSPRPPTAHQPTQRSAQQAGPEPALRRETVRQKKMAVLEKADSVDEDEFDKLVAINYKQLVDAPPTPTGTATLSPPIAANPRRSPKLSPRLARRPSPAEQAPPFSPAPPTIGGQSSRQVQQTAGDRQKQKAEEESEDELSK